MSADDGIYILKTPVYVPVQDAGLNSGERVIGGYEYRVSHLQAVENMNWDIVKGDYTEDQDVWIKNAREMWEGCKVFTNEAEAFAEAQKIYDEWVEDCGFVEYGICALFVDREF